ncbi:hypothetical protein APA24_21400 [Pseudomonas aeruginosa]|nr:hypothetical protein APA24_21400 [Pseudomonas aeruginosa]
MLTNIFDFETTGIPEWKLPSEDPCQPHIVEVAALLCDAAGQLDASFVLMMLTFREFIPQLLEALGGEEVPVGI